MLTHLFSQLLISSIISIIIFVPQCLVYALGRLRTNLFRAFFGWGGTNKPFSMPYAEIQGLFTAKLLNKTYSK
jgi:hypothetical protein